MLSALVNWSVKRRRLLAGVAGAAVETAAAFVPGVGLAAKVIGLLVEKGTEAALGGDEKPSAEQLAAVDAWVGKLGGCYAELLDRLERLPDAASLDEANRQVREALRHNAELAKLFDAHLVEARQMTLSLGLIERKLDEHFHAQVKMHAALEEIKEVFVHSPMMGEWHAFRAARPDAVKALAEADEHFLAGRRDEGTRALLGLLEQRGVGQQTVAHLLGLAELGRGNVRQAAAACGEGGGGRGAASALSMTLTRLSTTSAGKGGPAAAVWRSLPRGFVINRKYRVEDEVGRGGMASVYRAAKTKAFDRVPVVALKVPALSDDGGFAEPFEKEIDRSMLLHHDNVVRVFGYEVFDEPHAGRESYALVMEYVPGLSLARLLERRKAEGKPLSIDEVRGVMKAVCDGLEHAHSHNITHRDVKPHNVLVALPSPPGGRGVGGEGVIVKLMDFGIAREIDDSGGITRAGAFEGTLPYMAPELLHPDPESPPGFAADVYACGVLLRELLTFHPTRDVTRPDCPAAWHELMDDAGRRSASRRPTVAELRARLAGASVEARRASEGRPPTPVAVPAVPVASAAKKEPPKAFENGIGIKFVLVGPGKFLMGSPTNEVDRLDDEYQHEVTITRPCYLGVHQVTVGQWKRFAATGYKTEAERGDGATGWTGRRWQKDAKYSWRSPGFAQGDDHPVTCVSWNDAVAFCEWLKKTDPEHVYRLPSEAEWEYSCRGGHLTQALGEKHVLPFHFRQPTSSLSSTQANINGEYPYGGAAKGPYRQGTTSVGSFEPNVLGLFDMHGNVSEWCLDWYDENYYKNSPPADPPGPSQGSDRVVRGGFWCSFGDRCRAAARGKTGPSRRCGHYGFRVVAGTPVLPHQQ